MNARQPWKWILIIHSEKKQYLEVPIYISPTCTVAVVWLQLHLTVMMFPCHFQCYLYSEWDRGSIWKEFPPLVMEMAAVCVTRITLLRAVDLKCGASLLCWRWFSTHCHLSLSSHSWCEGLGGPGKEEGLPRCLWKKRVLQVHMVRWFSFFYYVFVARLRIQFSTHTWHVRTALLMSDACVFY